MEEVLGILTLEDGDGKVQLTVETVIDLLHHHQRDFLMGDTVDQCILQYMREGPMTDVVHKDSSLDGFSLRIKNENAFLLERDDSLAHQVEGT